MRKPRELAKGHMADKGRGQDSTGFLTLSLSLNNQKLCIQLASPQSLEPLPHNNGSGNAITKVSSQKMLSLVS